VAGAGLELRLGEASLRQRIGVWSIYRNGDPETDFQLCLRRTLSTAAHETGHILGMWHCTAYSCLMNGSNHEAERDRRLLHLCPVCLRKLGWNVRVEPVPSLSTLNAFCHDNGLGPERAWYERAMAALATVRE
jgi:archaemetzincin